MTKVACLVSSLDAHDPPHHSGPEPDPRRRPALSRARRSAIALAAVSSLCLALAVAGAANPASAVGQRATLPGPTIAAAGNIACDPTNPSFNALVGTKSACRMKYVSNLLVNPDGSPVYPVTLALGDTQYVCGGLSAFQQSYGPTWGRVFNTTRPVVGDKDYRSTANAPGGTGCSAPPGAAAGFFSYFGSKNYIQPGTTPGSGAYYSFNVPNGCTPDGINPCWHLIALNGNCAKAKGCTPGTPQYDWLAADLAAFPSTAYRCQLAFWHFPRFSSGAHGSDAAYDAIWRLLYQNGVDVVLNAHEHDYERFGKQSPDGKSDANGIREFIVGTGGASHVHFPSTARIAQSQASNDDTFGILTIGLHLSSYDWRFIPAAGIGTFTDAAPVQTQCH